MKKRILTLLLLISPYIYVLIIALSLKYSDLGNDDLPSLLLIFGIFVVVVFIPNMIYPFVMPKYGEKSTTLLFWNMILKLCNIPIYIIVFSIGFFMAMLPLGFLMSFLLAVMDYLMLLPSSMYGISGLLQARREKKITTTTAVVNCILHLFFCTDVISAVVMFFVVKARSKNPIIGE